MEQKDSKFNTLFIEIGTGVIFLGIIGFAIWFVPKKIAKQKKEISSIPTSPIKTQQNLSETWTDEGVRIPGNYADAEIIKIGEEYRIYYALEPEVQGFNGQIYTATSKDGLTWSEGKEIMKQATFPSVLKLEDPSTGSGQVKFRMYYQGSIPGNPPQNGIASAISDDGVNWTQEEDLRIKQGQKPGYDDENVGAPTVEMLSDGTFLMVYRGSAGENSYGKKDFNGTKPAPKDYLISATSKDGLKFEPKGIVVDSGNEKMRDQIDGPELVIDGDKIKLYCNSYEGVYILELDKTGKAANKPQIIIKSTGPDYAPADVTVIKMNEIWRMYYGLHTKGIHSARRM